LLSGSLSEACYLTGNVLPARLAPAAWRLSLRLNSHNLGAAVNRAAALASRRSPAAWDAFDRFLEAARNPGLASASDIFAARMPGRLFRALAARLLFGPSRGTHLRSATDAALLAAARSLAVSLAGLALEDEQLDRASSAIEALRSLEGDPLELAWMEAEVAFAAGEQLPEATAALLAAGAFLSPLDTLKWSERCLESRSWKLAGHCLEWARRWVPEEAATWLGSAQLELHGGDRRLAGTYAHRACSLDPANVSAYVLALSTTTDSPLRPAPEVELEVSCRRSIALGDSQEADCRIGDHCDGWTLHGLPSDARGVVPAGPPTPFVGGRATVRLQARRPSRLSPSGTWRPAFLAVHDDGRYAVCRHELSVPDSSPGRVLVAITEDHEIFEDRGEFSLAALSHLFLDKSRFAGSLGLPWTHMIETGSCLGMLRRAGTIDDGWEEMAGSVVDHLAGEMAGGGDLQPHLHWFNEPSSELFPYSFSPQGWRAGLGFLLTDWDARGDFAAALPPPPRAGSADRVSVVERCAAQVEEIARRGHPDHRTVLWRSGLLELGFGTADCAWSTVALLRAGLRAVSDLPKPSVPLGIASPAFACSWEQPFEPDPAGPMLQLPIAANLEGDYLMGRSLLARNARQAVGSLRSGDGQVAPGVHLFTLVTHEKFINSRAGADQSSLDAGYGDWATIRAHAAAWVEAGAELVLARDGVRAALAEKSWRPVAWLDEETHLFLSPDTYALSYRLSVLGPEPGEAADPFAVLVPVPPSLRPTATSARLVRSDESTEESPTEDLRLGYLWVRPGAGDNRIVLTLERPAGLEATVETPVGTGRAGVTLRAADPFARARVVIGWSLLGTAQPSQQWRCTDDAGRELAVSALGEGLLLADVSFLSAGGGLGRSVVLALEEQTGRGAL
jgi:tetratricopeptide (TPR) repeat protein